MADSTFRTPKPSEFLAFLKKDSVKRLGLALFAGVLSRASLLALAIIIARQFGAEDFGAFVFATGLALVVGQFAGLGWPILMNRLIPSMLKNRDWSGLRGLMRAGFFTILGTTTACAAIAWLFSLLATDLSQAIRYSALLMVPFTLCILRRQQLAALRKAHFGIIFDQSFGAIVTSAMILLLGGFALGQVLFAYAAATLLGTVIAASIVRGLVPKETFEVAPSYQMRAWMALGLPLLLGLASKFLLGKTDVLLLAPLSNLTEAGIYGAAYRITYLLTFPQVILMTIITPALSEAFANDKPGRVRRLLRYSLLFTALTTIPVVAALFVFPRQILGLSFGDEFAGGGLVLQLLGVGQTATCFAMVFSSILMMGGREKAFAVWNVVLLLANIALCLALIPSLGAVGAAIAAAAVGFAMLAIQSFLARPLIAGAFPPYPAKTDTPDRGESNVE